MKRTLCVLVSSLVVTVCAFGGFFFLAQRLGYFLGISEYASGLALIPLLLICVGTASIGAIVGCFLLPLVLRPFLPSDDFWAWIGAERGVAVPLLDPVLERWAALLYGKRTHNKRQHAK